MSKSSRREKIFKALKYVSGIILAGVVARFLRDPVIDAAVVSMPNIFMFFINLFYRVASTSTLANMVTMLLIIVFSYLFFRPSVNELTQISEDKRTLISTKKQLINVIEKCSDIPSKTYAENDNPNVDENIASFEEKIRTIGDEIEKSEQALKIKKKVTFAVLLINTLWFLFLLVYTILPLGLRESFNNSVDKIAPYTDSQTVEELRSDWVRMRSRSDYNIIKDQIEQIIKDNNLD